MDPAEVRKLLGDHAAPIGPFEPGYAIVPVDRLAAAGADVEAVERWVRENGGERVSAPPLAGGGPAVDALRVPVGVLGEQPGADR